MEDKKQMREVEVAGKTLKMVQLNLVKPYEKRLKIHSEKQILKIMQSIKSYGYTAPILVDEKNKILAGEARFEAMKRLGAGQIPVVKLEGLSPEQLRAYRLADNRLAEESECDKNLLKIEIKDLLELDFNILDTGFEIPEIDNIMFETFEDKSNEDSKQEVYSLLEKIPSRVKTGELWQLENHKLFCGDALDTASFKTLLSDEKAQLIITDPPYNVKIVGHVCGNGRVKHKEFAMAAGEMSNQEFYSFSERFMKNLINFSIDGSLHYIFIDWRGIKTFLNAGEQYADLKNICVWDKTVGGMGSLYRSQHELICLFKNGKKSHINNVQLGANGRYRTNVWSVKGMNPTNPQATELFKLHPTVKPTGLIEDIILDASMPGEVVLDCFGGSGSTLIACENMKRKAC